jgi:hypothetical protein
MVAPKPTDRFRSKIRAAARPFVDDVFPGASPRAAFLAGIVGPGVSDARAVMGWNQTWYARPPE